MERVRMVQLSFCSLKLSWTECYVLSAQRSYDKHWSQVFKQDTLKGCCLCLLISHHNLLIFSLSNISCCHQIGVRVLQVRLERLKHNFISQSVKLLNQKVVRPPLLNIFMTINSSCLSSRKDNMISFVSIYKMKLTKTIWSSSFMIQEHFILISACKHSWIMESVWMKTYVVQVDFL